MFDNYTQENISYQSDLKFIDNISSELDDLRAMIDYRHTTNGLKLYTDKDMKKSMNNIDNILLKRFKVPVKHVYSSTVYATIPLKLNRDTALVENADISIDQLKSIASICNDDMDCDVDIEPTTADTLKDASRICLNTLKNSKDLLKQISNGKIVIDRKNATIKGIKLTKPIYIMTDMLALIKNYNLTNREIIAIMLHEVGHIYTHIEYLWTTTNTDINNIEKILESLSNKDPKDRKLLLKSIDDTYGGSVDRINRDNKLYITNSEELADAFATRFGLSQDLITGLEKIKAIYVNMASLALIGTVTVMLTYLSILIMLLGAEALMAAYTFGLLVSTILTVNGIIFSSSDGFGTTYDSDMDRYRRIKNSLITAIRVKHIKTSEIGHVISSIDYMINVIRNLDDKSFIERMSDKMPWNYASVDYHSRERLIENLLDNELHYKIHKLKQGK